MQHVNDQKRIVVGVDGSHASILALQMAAELSSPLGCAVEAITAWTNPAFVDPYALLGWSGDEHAAQVLDEAITQAFPDGAPTRIDRHIVFGGPAPALIDASKGADMLIVGTRGHGGFTGLLLGSVSRACVDHAQCPVMVVPAHESHGSKTSRSNEAEQPKSAR